MARVFNDVSAAAATSDQEIRGATKNDACLPARVLANVVVVPVLEAALLHAFELHGDLAMGATLAVIGPGAPFGTSRGRPDLTAPAAWRPKLWLRPACDRR